MPDFVKENSQDDAEVQKQILNEKKAVASQIVQEEESERKTLYEQLQESKAQKNEQFSQLLSARNSSYKLDEKSAKFYNELKEKERAKELKEKDFEKSELERFRVQKAKVLGQEKRKEYGEASPVSGARLVTDTTAAILNGDNNVIKIKRKTPTETKKPEQATPEVEKKSLESEKPALIGIHGYSSSDED